MRSKSKCEFIANDSARKATYKKRKSGITKKLNELTILCGVNACAVICGPYDPQPHVWPSPIGVHHGISQYSVTPIQRRKTVNQEGFIRRRIAKVKQQVERIKRMNREQERELVVLELVGPGAGMGLQNVAIDRMNDTAWQIEKNLMDIGKKMETMQNSPPAATEASNMQQVNDQGEDCVAFGEEDAGQLHLAFGDISRREKDFLSKLFP